MAFTARGLGGNRSYLLGLLYDVSCGYYATSVLAGAKDPVLLMAPPDGMPAWIPDLRGVTVTPGAGHWVQQERPAEVNAAVLTFLASLAH